MTADTFPRLLRQHALQRSDRPAIREKSRGIWQTARDLLLDEARVVAPVGRAYPLQSDVWVLPVSDAVRRLTGLV